MTNTHTERIIILVKRSEAKHQKNTRKEKSMNKNEQNINSTVESKNGGTLGLDVPLKAAFYCPLDVYSSRRGLLYEAISDEYTHAIEEALEAYIDRQKTDMAEFFHECDSVSVYSKLVSAKWGVESRNGQLFGRIECSLKEPLTDSETKILKKWIAGQNSDGFGEGFEQQTIKTEDAEIGVCFWNCGPDYFILTREEFDKYIEDQVKEMR